MTFYFWEIDMRYRVARTLLPALAGGFAVIALFGANPSAYAETYGKTGKWFVDLDDNGNCLLIRILDVETYAFGLVWDEKTKTPYWSLLLNVPDFSFMSLQPAYPAELAIAGSSWTGTASADVADVGGFPFLFVRLPDDGFEQAFRKGSEFRIATKLGTYRIPLDSSAAGLDIYIACMTDPVNRATRLSKSP